jgi:penicillin amidase
MIGGRSPVVPLPRPRFKVWRGLAIAGISLALVLLLILSRLFWIARSALPELDGSLQVRGLSAPVSVTRDEHGLATIEAATLDDLFFAQGYVTASDRLFQMDILRRAAGGELAEVFGAIALPEDRRQRLLGIRAAAEKGAAMMEARERPPFAAYARGVNAYLQSHRGRPSLEFRLLGYLPRPWTIEDSLAVGYRMAETLSTSPQAAITREKILAKLGPELTSELYVNRSWRDHPPTVPLRRLDRAPFEPAPAGSDASFAFSPGTRSIGLAAEEEDTTLGSNNWVISGAHTTTGKPLLSNDMHLGHRMPNLWYEAHLRAGDFDVAGVSLPGYPCVIVGHNRRIAWGATNLAPTVEDAYVETFDDQGHYLTPNGWRPVERRRELIHVKGKPDVALDVELTRHGPIVSELVPGETRKIALRWTLYDGVHNPFCELDQAGNWQEFRRALARFDAPGQNMVYGDVDGNIGYQATGKIPIRALGDGSLPVDGATNAHEWIGYVAFDDLPTVLNPDSGILATANSRITPDGYRYSLSTQWEAPWRTDRIYRVLGSGKKFSAADMLALQTDIYSTLDRFLADRLVYAVDHVKRASRAARQAADILRLWDGQMTATSAAPTIASEARMELKRLLLEPKLGAAGEAQDGRFSWKSYRWMMETVWLEDVLSAEKPEWLPSGYQDYNQLLAAALEAALKRAPLDLNRWSWGQANSLTIQNPVLGAIPLLRHWTGPGEQPQSGSPDTVKAAGRDYGPSERMTSDLSNLDASTLNLVTGNSGNFLSPYYMDQWPAWSKGTSFPLPFSKSAVENTAAHRLLLVPK